MVKLSKAQRKAVFKLWTRLPEETRPTYRAFRGTVEGEFYGGGAVLVKWHNMYIGIEPDGYAHS